MCHQTVECITGQTFVLTSSDVWALRKAGPKLAGKNRDENV